MSPEENPDINFYNCYINFLMILFNYINEIDNL